MKYIRLTQGKFAKVDDEDFVWLNKYKWCAVKMRRNYYATRNVKVDKNWKILYMHILIIQKYWGLFIGRGKLSDHIDGNGLNNVKTNLRLCDYSQNAANQGAFIYPKSSKFKGVCWYKREKKWTARINKKGKRKHLGYYDDEIEAAQAYNEAAQKAFGDFARLNTF